LLKALLQEKIMADKNQNIKKALYTNDLEPGAIDPDDTTQSMPHDENEGMRDMINNTLKRRII